MTVTNLGVQGSSVLVSGTLIVSSSGLSGSVTGGSGSAAITVVFGTPAQGDYQITATAAFSETIGSTISVSGTLVGSVSVGGTNTVTAQITNLRISVGNGLVMVTGGTASLSFANGKIIGGSASGTIALGGGVNGVSVGGQVSVTFSSNGSFTVSGTNDTITVFGQTISGSFTVSDNGNGTVNVQVSSLNLSLGGGLVMVTGGTANFTITSTAGSASIVSAQVQQSAQSAQPASWVTLSASGTGPMDGADMMNLLSNGSVLIQDGQNPSGANSTGEFILSPQTNTGSFVNGSWSGTGSLNQARVFASSAVLPDGRVFVIGGEYPTFSNTVEIYNPATGIWTLQDSIPTPATSTDLTGTITGASGTPIVITTANTQALQNGMQVTITGVNGNTAANGTFTVSNLTKTSFTLTGSASGPGAYSGGGSWTASTSQFGDDPIEVLSPDSTHPDGQVLAGYFNGPTTYLFNPAIAPGSGQWTTTTGGKLHGDQSDEETWVKLPDGSILSYDVFSSESGTFHAQRYVPSTGMWVDASNLDPSNPPSILSDPATPVGNPPTMFNGEGDELGPGFLLPNGRVIIFGANGNTAIYNPTTNLWSAGPKEPTSGGTQMVATDDPGALLPNGHILISLSPLGFENAAGNYNFPAGVKIYDFDPTANTFTDVTPGGALGGTTIADNAFALNMVVLPSGQVLLSDENSRTFQIFTEDSSTAPQTAWLPTITSIKQNTGQTSYTLTGTQLNGISEGANYGDDLGDASNYPIVRLTDGDGNIFYAAASSWSSDGVATGSTSETVQFTLPAGKQLSDFAGGSIVVIANGIASLPFTVPTPPPPTITGTASGNVSVGGGVTGVTFTGTVTVNLTTTGFSVVGKGLSISVGGLPALTGDVTFTRDSTTGQIDVSIANMSIGGPNGPVTVSGSLTMGSAGLSGTLTGGIGPGSITVTFANGSFQVSASISTSFSDTIGPVSISGTISGSISSTGTGTLSLTNLTLSLAGGIVLVTGGNATLNETGGHITSGSFGGTVSLGGGVTGVSVGGTVNVTFATDSQGNRTVTITGTNDTVSVFGQTLTGNFTVSDNGNGSVSVQITALSLSLGNGLVTVTNGTANLTVASGPNITGTASGTLGVGGPISSFLTFTGSVSVTISATGLSVTGTSIQVGLPAFGQTLTAQSISFSRDSTTGALDASVTNLAVQGTSVLVSGTLVVSPQGLSGSVTGGIGSAAITVVFGVPAQGDYQITVTAAFSETIGSTVSISGQLVGSVSVGGATAASAQITNLRISIGNGLIMVTGGTASLSFANNKIVGGTASGTISIGGGVTGVSIGGQVSVTFAANGTFTITGTNDTVTVFGQTLSGSFTLADSGNGNVALTISGLSLSLGGGLVMVSGGAANFTIASGPSVTGTASGSLSVGSSETGVHFSGNVSVTIGSTSISVSGTGVSITVGSLPALTGDVTFTRDSTTGGLDVSVANMSVGGATGPVTVSGTLSIASGGLSGTLTGGIGPANVTVTFTGNSFAISAGVSASFSDNIGIAAISGTVSGNVNSTGTANLSLTNVMINVGNGLVLVTGGSATLTASGGHITSGTVNGTISLGGSLAPNLSLSGDVAVTFAQTGSTRTWSISGSNINLSIFGQTLTGNFTISDDGHGNIQIQIAGLTLSLGNVLSLTNGTANFIVSSAGIAGTGSATVSVTLPNPNLLSFNSTVGISIDTTHGSQNVLVTLGTQSTPASLTVAGQVLTGAFTFQKTTTSNGQSNIELVASNVSAFFGGGGTGLQISGGNGAVLILPTGVALDIAGTASLVGITNLALTGTLDVRINNTGGAVKETVQEPGSTPTQTVPEVLTFAANELDVTGTANLTVGPTASPFLSISAGFSISESTVGSLSKVLIGAVVPSAFVGFSGVGVQVTNADLGLALVNSTGAQSYSAYVLSATGTASLTGISALTLTGSLSIQISTLPAGVTENDTINVPNPQSPGSTIPVTLNFTGSVPLSLSGSVTLAIANFVSLSGSFTFNESSSNTMTVSASNVGVFIGVGGTTPIGLQVSGGELGLVLLANSNFALYASGNVALVGLPGLQVSGGMSILYNNTGAAQTNPDSNSTVTSIPNGGPTISVTGLTFAILDSQNRQVVAITITATIQMDGSEVDINASSVDFKLQINGNQIVELTGSVEFTIGADGFQLGANGFQITQFSFLGETLASSAAPALSPAAAGDPGILTPDGGASTHSIGPLTVTGLAPIFKHFSFSGGKLSADIGLSAQSASLNFGSGSQAGVTTSITGFSGEFQLSVGVDPSAFKITSFGSSGQFSIQATQFVLDVPNAVNVTASGVTFQYDPNGPSNQEIAVINSATVLVHVGSNSIQGSIAPYTDSNGNKIPGLAVYMDHFQLGRATLQYNGTLNFGSVVQIMNPSVSISDFSVSFNGSASFGGAITLAAGEVKIGSGAFQFTGTNVSATFGPGVPGGFSFMAGTLDLNVDNIVDLSANNVTFTPGATGSVNDPTSTPIVSFQILQAKVSVGSLALTGSAGSTTDTIRIYSDGIHIPSDFSASVSIGSNSASGLGWPSWVPIQISNLSITWPDFQDSPGNFLITFSASVSGTIGPVSISGSVTDVQIDVGKLEAGQFPIVGIASATISASGELFGAQISGTLILGVVKLDANGHALPPTATTFDHTVFYAGIMASFDLNNWGLKIRVGLSQNGPLQAYIEGDVEIPLPFGFVINQLYGGISFDSPSFPNVSSAFDLKSAAFTPGMQLTDAEWQAQLQQETVIQAGGGGGGYLFSVGSADGTDLNTGVIDSDLSMAFANNGDILSSSTPSSASLGQAVKPPQVITEQNGLSWLIVDSGNYYLVTTDPTDLSQLDVSKYQFVLDSAASTKFQLSTVQTLENELNAGTVTPDMIAAFANYNVAITAQATITTNAPTNPGDPVTSWTIVNGSYKYVVNAVGPNGSQVLAVNSSGGSMSVLNGVIRIEAAVTVGYAEVPASFFSGTADLIVETDGKILLNVYGQLGASGGAAQQVNFKLYADLSQVTQGSVKVLFYFENDIDVAGHQIPQLVIAGGVEFGYVDASNNFITPGSNTPIAGFGIKASGVVEFSPLPVPGVVTVVLTGEADVTFSPGRITVGFDATLSVIGLGGLIQANNIVVAAGEFVADYSGGISNLKIWGAAELQFTTGSIPFLQQAGISANVIIFLQINTDSIDHTVTLHLPNSGGTGFTDTPIDLQQSMFGLFLVGQLVFNAGPISFQMDGVFAIQIQTQPTVQFDMFLFANLQLGVAGENLFTFNALGLLVINDQGLAAELALNVDGSGLVSFSVNFSLFVNTTGQDQTYTLPNNLSSIINQVSDSSGSLNYGLLSALNAELAMLPHPSSVPTEPAGTLAITVPAGPPNLNEDGTFTEGTPGAYFLVQGHGSITFFPMVFGNSLSLDGSFSFQISADGIAFSANAEMTMGPLVIAASGSIDISSQGLYGSLALGATINLGTVGNLFGAASLEINTTSSPQTVKQYTFDFSTGQISNKPADVTIGAASGSIPFVQVLVEGKLDLFNAFSLEGQFLFQISGNNLTIAVTAHINAFFGFQLEVDGTATFYGDSNPGILIDISASINIGIQHVLTLSGNVLVQINTTGISRPVTTIDSSGNVTTGGNLAANSYLIRIGGNVQILSVITINATASVSYVNGLFKLTFDANLGGSLGDVLGVSLSFSGWIQSDGQFMVTASLSGGFNIADIISGSISGSLTVSFTKDPTSGQYVLGVGGSASLNASILGFGVGVNIGFYLSSDGHISFDVNVTLHFLFFSISFGFTVEIGVHFDTPPPVYLGGTSSNHQVDPGSFAGGILVLNVGNLASNRGSQADPSNTDEMVVISGGQYDASTHTQDVTVTMFGVSQTFQNVSEVVAHGDGNNVIGIDSGMQVPVDVTAGGAGKTAYIIDSGLGGGNLSIAGNNSVVEAGSGPETITDTGVNDIIVSGGRSPSDGGPTPPPPQPETVVADSSTTVLWNSDFGPVLNVHGAGGTDRLFVTANDSQSSFAHGENLAITQTAAGTTQISHVAANSVSITNIPSVFLSATGGNNQIAIGDLNGSDISTFDISYGADHSQGNSVAVAGGAGADQFTLTTGQDTLFDVPTPLVPDPFPNTTGTTPNTPPGGVPITVNTVTIARTGGATIELLGVKSAANDSLAINGKGGNDTFYVTGVGISTSLQGNDVSAVTATPITTTYDIGWQGVGAPGVLSGINAALTIVGSNSIDTAVVDDSGDFNDASYVITPNAVVSDALGANGSISYDSKLDDLVLLGGDGNNDITVKNTGAAVQTAVHGGNGDDSFIVNGPLAAPLALNGDGSLTGNDTLTVNGTPNADTFVITPTTVNGDGAAISFINMDAMTLLGNGGNDSFTLNGDAIDTTIQGANGNDTFIINGISAPTTINGGPDPSTLEGSGTGGVAATGPNAGAAAGTDVFIINAAAAPLTINGFNGSDTFTVNGNASNTVINGGTGQDTFTVNGNSASLTLNGGPLLNTFTVNSNSAQLAINSPVGAGTYNINNISSPLVLNSGSASATYHFVEPLFAPVTIAGGATVQTLIVDGTSGADFFTITTSSVQYLGAAMISYSGPLAITINGKGGSDTFTLDGNTAATTINGATGTNAGHNTFNIQAAAYPVTLSSGSVSSVINLGSRAPLTTGGNLDAITAAVTITGSGQDTLNLDDSASGLAKTAVLTGSTLTGFFGPIGLTYSGIATLNISLGSRPDSLTVNATAAKTSTTIDTGTLGDTLNIQTTGGPLTINAAVGALAPNTYNLNGVTTGTGIDSYAIVSNNGKLALQGSTTPLSGVADYSTQQLAAELSAGQVTPDLVAVFALSGITLTLGSPVLTQTSPAGTSWTVTDSTNHLYTVEADANGVLSILQPLSGAAQFSLAQIESELNANALTSDLIQIFKDSGVVLSTSATVSGAGPWTVTDGATIYTLTASGSVLHAAGGSIASTLADIASVSFIQLEMEMTTGVVTGDLTAVLTASGINLSNTTVKPSRSGTSWTITGTDSSAHPQVYVLQANASGSLTLLKDLIDVAPVSFTQLEAELNSGAITTDLISVFAASGITLASAGRVVVNSASSWTVLGDVQELLGAITIHGSGHDTINLDDTGDSTAQSLLLTPTAVTGLGTAGIQYAGVSTINMSLGSGGNTVTLNDPSGASTVSLNSGAGNDTVNVIATPGATSIATGGGTDTVNVGSLAPATGGNLAGIHGNLSVNGLGGSATLNLDETGDASARIVQITSSAITGLGSEIDYANLANLNVNLGSGVNAVTIAGTSATTSLNTGPANDTVNVLATSNPTTVNTSTGVSVVNVGNGGLDSSIAGPLTVTGAGSDTLNINDSMASAAVTATITPTTVSLSDAATISYSGIGALNVRLGKGGNTVTIAGTASATTTDLYSGAGSDTVIVQSDSGRTNIDGQGGTNTIEVETESGPTSISATGGIILVTVGSAAPASLTGIQGPLTVIGAGTGNNSLVVDDSGSGLARNGTLTSTSFTGFGMGPSGITYGGLASLTVNMSAAGNSLTVASTGAATTTINGGAGNDTVTVQGDSGVVNINTGGGKDSIFVQATSASSTTVTTQNAGTTTLNIGRSAIVDQVLGSVTLRGGTADALIVDDSANVIAKSAVTLTPTTLQGLSPGLITFSGLASLKIDLGSGNDSMSINGTPMGASTTVNMGPGNDSLVLDGDNGPTAINMGTGANTIAIQATGAPTTIKASAGGTDTITVSNAGRTSDITGAVTVLGAGADTLTIDDSADTIASTVVVTSTTVTGAAPSIFTYSGLSALTVKLGSGNNSATISSTSASTTTSLFGGAENDSVTVQGDSGPVNIDTRGGANTVSVIATGGVTNIAATGGSNAVTIGNNHIADGINGTVNVTGTGADTLTIDDSGNSAAKTAVVSSSSVTGVSPAAVNYTGLAKLTVLLGSGSDNVTIASTNASTTTLVNTGGGNDSVRVNATSGPTTVNTGSGVNTVSIGTSIPSTVNGIQGALTIIGSGHDSLSLDDSGSTVAKSGTLTTSTITGLGMGSGITFSGLSLVSITLGSGGNTFTIASTPAATVLLSSGKGNDTVNVQSTAAGSQTVVNTGAGTNTVNIGNSLSLLAGLVTVTGNGGDILNVNDTAATAGKTGQLSASSITGFGSAGINYGGIATLNLNLGAYNDTLTISSTKATTTTNVNTGAGNDTVNVLATSGPTNINSGTGSDTVNVGSNAPLINGGTLAGIQGVLTFTGHGSDKLNLDDSVVSTPLTLTVSGSTISASNAANVNYSGLSTLAINLGSGSDTIKVTGTSATGGTTINSGLGNDGFTVTTWSGSAFTLVGPLTLDPGTGVNSLTVDDSADPNARNIVVTGSTITNLGGPITYGGFSNGSFQNLTILLGTSSTNSITATGPLPVNTTIQGGGTSGAGTITYTGDFTNNLTLVNLAHGSLVVTGNFLGNLTATALGSIVINGQMDTGMITVGSINTIWAPNLISVASNNYVVLQVTQGGVLRQIQAGVPVSGSSNIASYYSALPSTVTFAIAYDGSTLSTAPQAAIRITNSTSNQIELALTSSSVAAKFDLSRLDAFTTTANLSDVAVEGDLLATVTSAQTSLFHYAAGTTGGVYLPNDAIVGVAVRDNAANGSIRVKSLMAVAFATLNGKAASSLDEDDATAILTTNPSNHNNPYATVTYVSNGRLRIPIGSASVGIFADDNDNDDDLDGPLGTLSNELSVKSPLTAFWAEQVSTPPRGWPWYMELTTSVAFVGDGGSLNTGIPVVNVSSTGPLGDLLLSAGTNLTNLTAPSIFGNVNLYGGSITGTFQTTGIRIDPITGATSAVAADLGVATVNSSTGKITAVTTFSAGALSGKLIVRGNLVSSLTLSGSLTGLLAVQGDIGVIQRTSTGAASLNSSGQMTRFGGITLNGGTTTGNIVADGNDFADIDIDNSLAGRIAIEGVPVSGLASTRFGILGNLSASSISSTAAIVTLGQIGDATQGTSLSFNSQLSGFLAAIGSIRIGQGSYSSSRVFQNLAIASASAVAIQNIWTNGGLPLTFDVNPLDQQGLNLILTDLTNLKIGSNGALTGTVS